MTWLGPQNYDNLGVDAAELIRQAIAQHADAIVGPDWVPDAMDPAFKAVVDAKIPLIIYNAGGIEAADRLGAMNYRRQRPTYKAGVAAGDYFAKHDSRTGLPQHASGRGQHRSLLQGHDRRRHGGRRQGLGSAAAGHVLRIGYGCRAGAERPLAAASGVDAVFAIGNVDTNSAISGITQAGKKGKVHSAA